MFAQKRACPTRPHERWSSNIVLGDARTSEDRGLPVPVFMQVGELQEALEAIKWGTDYLLACHTEPKKFVAMYGQSEARPPRCDPLERACLPVLLAHAHWDMRVIGSCACHGIMMV